MDANVVDALARSLTDRRATLALLVGGVASALGLTHAVDTEGKQRNKKRKKHKKSPCEEGEGCAPTSPPPCAGGTDCSTGECCCAENVFVRCPEVCRCTGNEDFCCADTAQKPEQCPSGSDVAVAFCCAQSSVCGDYCCDPGATCVNGNCQCLPANTCGPFCCDPRFTRCDQDGASPRCACIDPLNCPSGTGGFARVRRVR